MIRGELLVVYANARLRWEYRPGSELFVVLNEERNRKPEVGPALLIGVPAARRSGRKRPVHERSVNAADACP